MCRGFVGSIGVCAIGVVGVTGFVVVCVGRGDWDGEYVFC